MTKTHLHRDKIKVGGDKCQRGKKKMTVENKFGDTCQAKEKSEPKQRSQEEEEQKVKRDGF
ncbi:hypothetical protein ERO13_D06G120133v2 [Gossypium hirsutum]|uniref:Uncharacterized protein n=1 Tax=Gossypium darwinii TaxID=34276 RepID=A0A5D2C5W3_GOSDA|nr:hypothetical protein ERO13_D06G120133v2 [Gossypium hirsutum]TYG64987.1 hypothetical protein ES288_D06G149600v1 [Gossypium darwinii]